MIETIVQVTSGTPKEFAIRERQPEQPKDLWPYFFKAKEENGYEHKQPAIWVDWVELEGPLPLDSSSTGLEAIIEQYSDTYLEEEKVKGVLQDFAISSTFC